MWELLAKINRFWKTFVISCNDLGVPLPLIRDPKSRRGDVALTLVVLSSIYVQISLIGKWSGRLGGIETSDALSWFYSCAGLYFARKMSSEKVKKTNLPTQELDDSEDVKAP